MKKYLKCIVFILFFGSILFKIIFSILPADAFTDEIIYTFNIIYQYSFPLFFPLSVFLGASFLSTKKKFYAFRIIFTLALFFATIPICASSSQSSMWIFGYIFSICWILFFFFSAISFFIGILFFDKNNFYGGILSVVGSVLLALSCMEIFLLTTHQPTDGIFDDTNHSKYIHQENVASNARFQKEKIGDFPAALGYSYSVAHRVMRFDDVLFDVKYTFDGQGHRIIPQFDGVHSRELMLFGCSFTFGHGLDNEQTWAWQLANLLGGHVKIVNYGMSAFGAHQMLTMLEENMVSLPPYSRNNAFFLAIEGHLRRNAGFLNAPFVHNIRYALGADGKLHRDGFASDNPIRYFYKLSHFFNGSQLVSHFVNLIYEKIISSRHQEFLETYLAILEKSSMLLHEKYHTELTVLLWPDIEYIAPLLKQKGVSFVMVRPWLTAWDAEGPSVYRLHPEADSHPNFRATQELAEGLAELYRDLQMD